MCPRRSACVAVAALAGLTAACGSSGSSSTKANSSRPTTASAEAQIKQNWVKFFSPSTAASARVSLLQNGARFVPAINAEAKSPLAKQSAAKVTAVRLTSSTTARVTYTVLLAGVAALKDVKGNAVKTGGTWQVSDASFCALLKLQGPAPAACPKG